MVKRWLRSLYVQLVFWALMPVAFVIIAISFTGVYAHQKSMRDFVIERNGAMTRMAARIGADGLARGVVDLDGAGLDAWMDLDHSDLPGGVMVIDRTC